MGPLDAGWVCCVVGYGGFGVLVVVAAAAARPTHPPSGGGEAGDTTRGWGCWCWGWGGGEPVS